MTADHSDRRRLLIRLALGLGLLAVLAGTSSFLIDDSWALRGIALLLIILGLAAARMAYRQPPPVDGA